MQVLWVSIAGTARGIWIALLRPAAFMKAQTAHHRFSYGKNHNIFICWHQFPHQCIVRVSFLSVSELISFEGIRQTSVSNESCYLTSVMSHYCYPLQLQLQQMRWFEINRSNFGQGY